MIANIVTGFRVLTSMALLFCPVFSPTFYILYLTGVLLYGALTYLSYKKACADFEKIDL